MRRAKRTCIITLAKNTGEIKIKCSVYDRRFVEELKKTVPSSLRCYDPETRTWTIWSGFQHDDIVNLACHRYDQVWIQDGDRRTEAVTGFTLVQQTLF